jgi:Tfp pilus assembly protein PilV
VRAGDRGVVLLEVLVALTLLLLAGVSVVTLVSDALRSESALRDRERETQELDRVMTAMTLLQRADLDRRLGRHPVGPFAVDVQRPEQSLYRIAVTSAAGGAARTLVTVVYRRDDVRP